jgi:Na+/glutamate symporter
MSDAVVVALIASVSGLMGVIIGTVVNVWAQSRREIQAHENEIRLRLIGKSIQTSEVMGFITSQRKRMWPLFWKRRQPRP